MSKTGIFVSLNSSRDGVFERLELLSGETVVHLDVWDVAATDYIVPNTVVNSTLFADYNREVYKVSAEVALVGVFGHRIAIMEKRLNLEVLRNFFRCFDRESRAHFALHERPLSDFKLQIVREFR